jgi:RNA polymerase sigma-70 factor (ECF subfamily)
MEDSKIIDLYWSRSENAITETETKYGRYCHSIAYNILRSDEDSEECVSDTYLKAWNAMPPQRPEKLSSFLGKITRNLALNMYEKYSAKKRGGGQVELAIDELSECIPSQTSVEKTIDDMALSEILNGFLAGLPEKSRKIFMGRYWYLLSIKEIAEEYHMGESRVKVTLFRLRKDLKEVLEKEGITL